MKTINPSEDETKKRTAVKRGGIVEGFPENRLSDKFFGKLEKTIEKAKSQLLEYANDDQTLNLIFLAMNFDDQFGEFKEELYSQIDEYLQQNPVGEFEIVFFNPKTVFHKDIAMKLARVLNEKL